MFWVICLLSCVIGFGGTIAYCGAFTIQSIGAGFCFAAALFLFGTLVLGKLGLPSGKPKAMWAEPGKDYVFGYMCLVDFECEMGAADGGVRIYPSLDELIERRKCVVGCGIVKVKVEGVEVIHEPPDDGSAGLDHPLTSTFTKPL
jgi:hypothetical protein